MKISGAVVSNLFEDYDVLNLKNIYSMTPHVLINVLSVSIS